MPGYLEAKGFKDPTALAESYRNLEKLKGVPEERLLQIPEKADSPEWDKIYSKLGRPEKPSGYELKGIDGQDTEFGQWAGDIFHKSGVSKKAGEAIVSEWNKRVMGIIQKDDTDAKEASNQQVSKLRQEWGAAFDQNSTQVRAFSEAVGLDDKTAKDLAKVMGVDKLNTFLHGIMTKFGVKLGEQDFHGGGGGNGFGVLSPAAARAKIDMLKNDSGFVQRYASGDSAARQEMDRLHQWGYPPPQS